MRLSFLEIAVKINFVYLEAVAGFWIVLSSSLLLAPPCLAAENPPRRCSFITEFGYSYRINSASQGKYFEMVDDVVIKTEDWDMANHHFLISEFGLCYDLDAKSGIGLSFCGDWNFDNDIRRGLKFRVRRRLNQKKYVDLSAGALLWGIDPYIFKQPIFIGGGGITFDEWRGLNLFIEISETQSHEYYNYIQNGVLYRGYSKGKLNIGFCIGYKLSSTPGLVCNGLAAAVGLAYLVFLASLLPYK